MPSTTSRKNERWNYDVFLNFRGADTRKNFTAHLYQALRDKGINVFIDNELQRGGVITSELLRVIEKSRILIPLLSKNYASSSFCLDELEKILECRISKGQTVIPVFYHVDPSEVEAQAGAFGQEFAKLEAQLNDHLNHWKLFPAKAASLLRYIRTNVSQMWPVVDNLEEQRNDDDEAIALMERMQKWRSALTEVSRLSGWQLGKGDHESSIINGIVKMVSKKLDYTPLYVAKYPVGLASRVEFILQRLNIESLGVCTIGLHGIGGVGKTTIATALYNRCASQFEFEGICFLPNVRDNSKKRGLAELQQTLLFEILGDQEHSVKSSEKGIELMKRVLRNKKVLIVIDDVDHLEQLQQLAGDSEWFVGGSVIIITTRDLHLLKHHQVTMIHEIKELEFDEALELFSRHAFGKPQPDEAYTEFSSRLIRYTGGSPLALKMLGSSLHNRSAPQWEYMLKKLEQSHDEEINDVLKVCYDSLDNEEKAIFLHIACFFKGKYEDEVAKFLDVCGFSAHLGIQRLVENSLAYVATNGTLEMHYLLEAMGTKIALEESFRLRIRKREDIPRLFLKDKAAHVVEILELDLHGEEEVSLNWLESLTKLRVLTIRNGHFNKMPKRLPHSIRWLKWRNTSLKSIPSGFLPPDLLVLEMPGSNIKRFSAEMHKAQNFLNLTRMDFSGSKHLREMVDLSSFPNLEELYLTECENLRNIPRSIGNLKKLRELDLVGCRNLTSLPSLVENQRLTCIALSHCSKLENLPNLPTALTRLYMKRSDIKKIPLFIGNLINLKYIEASNCRNLIYVSNSIYKLPNVDTFALANCPNLPHLPEAESSNYLTSTTVNSLDLSRNKFVSLPVNTFKFIEMRFLAVNDCEWLAEIPELPHTLESLHAQNCKSLVRFSQFQFDNITSDFSNCHNLVENEMQSWREMVENLSVPRMEADHPSRKYSIILPGNEIPEWFTYVIKREGAIPSFHLSSPVASNRNLIGIAWCVVFQYPHPRRQRPHMPFGVTFKMNNLSLETLYLSDALESEHMWLGFYTGFDMPQLWEGKWISFKLESLDIEAVYLGDLGVQFIYKN